ncbi:MAG: hypothetical protein ACRESJ_27465 [Pseudomonas sp.]|uniref:hypothetical protein n=1 Tax=Pseudomonas sp. TaxID=306 RepID=UPI003D6FDDDF
MIYIKLDINIIPKKLLLIALKAQQELALKPEGDRKEFIEKNARIWRAFAQSLARMSYGKCWYSESNDPQSFFDVDHFRPKKEAKRAENQSDDGYPWLAFSWENFRYSAARSNRLNKDEVNDLTVGKGSWFPLINGSVQAEWNNRCEAQEKPVLLDPLNQADVSLIEVDASGNIHPSFLCVGETKKLRVYRSAELYGLNLPKLVSARKKVMRDIQNNYDTLIELITEDKDRPAIDRHQLVLKEATMSNATYALAARSKLQSLPKGYTLCAQPEDIPPPYRWAEKKN